MRESTLRKLGAVLIVLGVLAWVPYAILKYALDVDVSVVPFLVWHLLGVVPGSKLFGGSIVMQVVRTLRQRRTARESIQPAPPDDPLDQPHLSDTS